MTVSLEVNTSRDAGKESEGGEKIRENTERTVRDILRWSSVQNIDDRRRHAPVKQGAAVSSLPHLLNVQPPVDPATASRSHPTPTTT